MSPTDPGRFTDPAATWHRAELAIPLQSVAERLRVLDDDPSEAATTTDPRPSPVVSSAAARPRPDFRQHPYADPCNYLG